MLRRARLTRGNTLGGGVWRSLHFAPTEKRRRSRRNDIKRNQGVTIYCAPHIPAMPRCNSPGQEFGAGDSLRSPSLPKSRKDAGFEKRPPQLRKHRVKPVLPKPNPGETRKPT